MKEKDDLRRILNRIDGRGYKAYKDIRGRWAFPDFALIIDHVQGDPFAAPSRLRAVVPSGVTGLPRRVSAPEPRAVGVACLLARRFRREADRLGKSRGSGKSGRIGIAAPGQEVLEQTAVRVEEDGAVEVRFTAGLPARGRKVMGRQAEELLCETVPEVVATSVFASAYDEEELVRHALVNEDAEALRASLEPLGLVAFVADGSVLPRRTGVDDRPLEGPQVVPFESPDPLRVEVELPNAGVVTGMGIPRGITLVVGGGYHGKSTLLRGVEQGVYNHRPGDGREQVVSDPAAVKIRAEDGRAVTGVDISPFIGDLPGGVSTRDFSTENASGSTSQAAGTMEAVEAGARVLLVDEDTAATNFMIRDRRMQALVPREREPITPFIDRIRELHREHGVSSILVLGGSGDYLDVADTVLAMTDYTPSDVTETAQTVARDFPTGRVAETPGPVGSPPRRIPAARSVDPSKGKRSVNVKVRDEDGILFGAEEIDLQAVDQIVSRPQLRAVSEALVLARRRFMDGKASIPEILDRVMEALDREGLDVLSDRKPGDLARFRRHELAAALNRLRALEIRSD